MPYIPKRVLLFLIIVFLLCGSAQGEKWSIAVISDSHQAYSNYRNVLEEIRHQTANSENKLPPFDFVLACGDMIPAAENYKIYKEVFPGHAPAYFPVRGNHESDADVHFIISEILKPNRRYLTPYDTTTVSYYVDWKNVRLVVLDQYGVFGKGFGKRRALEWVSKAIDSAGRARHIFVAFHEPFLLVDTDKDPFWQLLNRHADRVRAVFAGHTHAYMKLKFGEKENGIYYITAGNAGQNTHSDGRHTIIEVLVDEAHVTFLAVQAPGGTKEFTIRDRWEVGVPVNAQQSAGQVFP